MRPKLYMADICPCGRAVLLTAEVLQVTLEVKTLSLSGKDPVSGQFHKLNPLHAVPTLEDSGYVIWDSHAIIAYLVGKYGKDDSLYPKDLKRRSVIDQRLRFDSGVMAFFTRTILNPIVYDKINVVTDEQIDCLNETYEVLEHFFDENNQWIAGEDLTIADLSLIPSITFLDAVIPIDESKFPKVIKWIRRAETMPFYETNRRGLIALKASLKF